ncbi:MAG: SDR family NAD(P)-dependent oxidoreductase [Burkholderiales bacterium]|nr:SDR family NAD(P)-dependent oxidoreductase [Burkholderiales bacterium]
MKRLWIAGFGDIARRAAPKLGKAFELRLLSRKCGRDLDRPGSLAGLEPADALLHCAPPPASGVTDTRTANLLDAFDRGRILPTRIVYISTSGVYGDCDGALVDELRAVNPQSARAARRVDAEARLALWCNERGSDLVVLRAPGIYAADRLPLARLRAGTPVLRERDDVYTSHIHADDLAAACARALEDGAPAGIYNAADDSRLRMGEWLDLVADRAGLPRPPRIARADAGGRIPPELLSFMDESRRLDNTRLKRVLGLRLRYPTVREGLTHALAAGADQPA